jgi:hypothetical protein
MLNMIRRPVESSAPAIRIERDPFSGAQPEAQATPADPAEVLVRAVAMAREIEGWIAQAKCAREARGEKYISSPVEHKWDQAAKYLRESVGHMV